MVDKKVLTGAESLEALQLWANEIEIEIAEITASIIPLQQRLEASREKLDLVQRLIHLSNPNVGSSYTNIKEISQLSPTPTLPEIEDSIESILASCGKPMHISDIRASLIQLGIPLPGRGDEANIILRLRRANNRFIRTARGTYGLISWMLPEYSPTPIKKKFSRRRKVKK
jgi:hypothetical protein